jgi:hypothetical protein
MATRPIAYVPALQRLASDVLVACTLSLWIILIAVLAS